MTYTELVQKIRDYTEVTSTVLTDTIVNGFIENAEFRILRDVDSDNNRRYVTAQLIAGTRFIDTPQNLLVIRSAQIVDSDGTANPDNRDFLQYRDTSFMSEFNNLNSQGVPKYYSNWDEDTVVVAPTPDADLYNSVKLYLETRWIIEYSSYYIFKSAISQRTFVCMPS